MLAAVVTALLMLTAAPVPADGDEVEASAQPWGYLLTGQEDRRSGPAAPAARKSRVTCSYERWFADGQENGGLEFIDPASGPSGRSAVKGAYYLVECSDGYRDVVWLKRRPASDVTPERLARRAYERIRITPPRVLTAPPRGREGVVGLAHWFYLAEGQWVAKSRRLRAGQVWAEATAAPQRLSIDTGDGGTLTCRGPGVPYDPARPAYRQSSPCSHLYRRPSDAYQVTVSVTWNGTWRGSGGTGGSLPPVTRSVTFPIRVVEAQALTTKG